MLAVGSRVGTLFAQSIYTVSGPFHPFGGAVDIIVVQQEDGTFKSSPWYVKFGKFQGVLKRTEKKVVVSVNDVDANFHMYLDHKGEAYFLKDDVTDDSPLAIEDSAAPSPNDATSSAGENSVEPVAVEDSKEEEGQDAKIDHDKEESEDERGDDLELTFEGRGSSRELFQQSVGERAAAAVLELALGSQVEDNTVDVVGFTPVLGGEKVTSADAVSSSNLENRSSADVCEIDVEAETSGAIYHAFENEVVDLVCSQGSSKSSAFVTNSALDVLIDASSSELGTLEEIQESDRGIPGKSGQFIHGLLNKAVGLQQSSSSGLPTAVIASAALDSLSKVVSDIPSTSAARHGCTSTEQVELSEEDVAAGNEVTEADYQVSEGIRANSTDSMSSTYVDNRSYADIVRADIETETTSGTVIHALLNQAVGIEVSQSSSQSTVLVANAALEVLTAASLPEVATSSETQVPDWESSSSTGKIIHGLLNKAIGLQASASSGPASALIAKAVLDSLSNVLSGTHSGTSNGSADLGLVELSEEDVDAENEVGNGAAGVEEAGSLIVDSSETAVVPVPPETSSNDKLVFLVGGRQYPWTIAAPTVLGLLAFGQVRIAPARTGAAVSGEQPVVVANGEPAAGTLTGTSSGGWRLWPFGRSARTPEQVSASALLSGDSDALMLATDAAISSQITKEYLRRNGYYKKPRKIRTNSPSSQQLASLGLKEGSNKITFTFFTRVLGKQQVDARIYLWKWNARIVISDVDGTITKSDVLGQVMPLVGKDWTQSGVAKLFSAIKKNGYELMFLSARAISQADITRHFLEGIIQDGQQLPDGPVVISPDGLFPSLYREVIRRAPHEFKIACLEDIKSLFPAESKPFYAGFGNRDTDEFSYLKVGISKGKIFIINPKGEVMVNNQVDVKSYTSLHKRVDDMFPGMTFTEQEDFNEWNFWKLPLPQIEDDEIVKR